MPMPSRILRYSGSDRPACRMNQTGVCGTGRPRQARTNAESPGVDGEGAVVTRDMVPCARSAPRGAAIDDGQG
jgi:hypothetical protein